MNSPALPLSVLVQFLRLAKAKEAEAIEARRAIEDHIVSRYAAPDGGEGTVKDGDLIITYKVTRAIDTAALQSAWAGLRDNAKKVFRWKADIDTKNYRSIVSMDADSAYQVQGFITTKPAKPILSLKETS